MHHHHPPLPITGTATVAAVAAPATGNPSASPAVASGSTAAASTSNVQQQQQQQQQRRRKKRPNYNYNGTRTVEVRRGYNGFGFTISGQQPCRLSCIISSSPAEQAGLRSGDFLISVNGLNVSKLPHETVVQLIGNSFGSIRMQIAENYYSDSSDEENANATLQMQRSARGQLLAASLRHKPRFLHHKSKMHRLRNSPHKKLPPDAVEPKPKPKPAPPTDHSTLRPVLEDAPLANLAGKSADVANVSAMVRAVGSAALEYRVIVGYLGTIEMPKQISHSSKLQTVRSCIRKLRQEKRQPTIVLMCITPDSLTLQSANGGVLATYASSRLNYVSSSSESENRFFGLVTSAVHNTQIEEEYVPNAGSGGQHISISHSCHVFVIDTKLIDHGQHLQRAHEFRLQCTRDPISNLCLEFPNNSEYVVNLIRSMYTMRILPPASRSHQQEYEAAAGAAVAGAAAHSPQPSNHSEISTTTSNSDSGIGFNNDCTNISDRILVVDFLGAGAAAAVHPPAAPSHPAPARPQGIVGMADNRLTVRAMPDPAAHQMSPSDSGSLRRPNLLASFNLIKSPATNLTSTRSCDDVLNLFVDDSPRGLAGVASMDDISLHSTAPSLDEQPHMFAHPSCVPRKPRRSLALEPTPSTPHKLSVQVFGQPGSRHSLGFEAIDSIQSSASVACVEPPMDTWASLQNLHKTAKDRQSLSASSSTQCLLEATNSEPDLGNRALPANASPFRRAWGQSSFRTPRTDKVAKQLQPQQQQQSSSSPLVRRTASMNASDHDVYIKTLMLDDLKTSARSQQQLSLLKVPKILTTPAPPSTISVSAESTATDNLPDNGSPSSWGGSFERMLQDAAGMQTFSEFLKKEFSAENIYFWTACERYRLLESEAERAIQARDIFGKHLANSSSDPVNVDSQARNLTEEKLASAAPDIFAPAQKQIFNLMKFDSYQRFIRSDLYKSCVEAEQKNLPLPYSGADLDELLKTNFHLAASSKLKKSVSNAEDRRRKSLLPWHRKTRSKSRDRTEIMSDLQSSALMPAPPLPPPTLLTSASLKIASGQNSLSDLHSSRSSLSSFDAGVSGGQGASAESVCSLCRVILTDGATTIVQTRPGETVGQLVERLLEKRNLVYPYYDIVFQGSTKSIDLQQSSQLLAGKEVVIERRVAFKLDLPDPKVISVKSKPKKQLHEVIRPILTKYNYKMDNVQVIMRDTQAPLDLMQPVTMADGQRLRIVLLQDFQSGGGSSMPPKQTKPMKPLPSTAQGQLDELTNKVFNELLQSKAEAAAAKPQAQHSDLCSMKSNEAPSECSSSLFERMRRQQQRDNIPGSKLPKLKKKSTSSQHSEEPTTNPSSSSLATTAAADPKKPIIAKLKAGVKLQVTERVAEHQDELLEGLKRAQLARLEDQRGTEINFDLPDFLKNKENLNAAVSKLRKVRANLSPVTSKVPPSPTEIPQPAPRLSITRSQQVAGSQQQQVSPMKVDQEQETEMPAETQDQIEFAKAPPPLPPKPKVLPIKPSNWGVAVPQPAGNYCNKFSPTKQAPTSPTAKSVASAAAFVSKIPLDIGRKSLEEAVAGTRCAYLDEPSSSFV
ncbi:regulator of G-protein signaling loco isoform X1 [Drosophila subobscura]|uniref:regulator of G-protein signaling loco isoform X1 n=1 Tax=Drosophila subobscura TaxID=7241 RepID=UPI00155A4CB2|nr:regulator of G-protein signaling loco isoform X1 [Drosophila subobscura]